MFKLESVHNKKSLRLTKESSLPTPISIIEE